MTKTLFILFLLLGSNLLFSQNGDCDCLDELQETSQIIKNAKSYKTQIKKKNKVKAFNQWEEKIQEEIINDSLSDFFCVGYLQKYISFIDDRHNQIYFIPNNISENVPTYSNPIDSNYVGKDSISGIYYAGNEKILLKKESDHIWFGIMLASGSPNWPKGKIRLRINKMENGDLELFEYFQNGLLLYQKNIEISNGRIHGTFWNKANKYNFNRNYEDNFIYKSINPSFCYIGISTFKRTKKLMQEGADFYDNNLDKLTKKNLIIDLRNNGGGSLNQAKPLLKSIKRNKSIQKIYVLINFKTGSTAELTALKLKEDKRTLIVGENSKGMLQYGYGNRAFSTKTNCSEFNVVLTTKQMNRKFSKFEYIGIAPDIQLNNQSAWTDQIINLNTLSVE